jgi:hypothetical protein
MQDRSACRRLCAASNAFFPRRSHASFGRKDEQLGAGFWGAGGWARQFGHPDSASENEMTTSQLIHACVHVMTGAARKFGGNQLASPGWFSTWPVCVSLSD